MCKSVAFALALCSSLYLSGCSSAPVMTSSTQTIQAQGAAIKGRVHGGQNPISGAHVYLYAANTTGYGGFGISASSNNASTSLLNSNVLSQVPSGGEDSDNNYYVTTDSGGNFSITGDYTCPSASSQVYLYSVGGNPGLGLGTNSSAGLLAALGTCSTLTSSTFVVMNEVSTIATAYAIAGYATDATHVSSSGTTLATTGIANAFASVTNLETLSTGVALATTPVANGGNGTVPQSEINTLANILASCINSSGAVTGPPNPTPCDDLFVEEYVFAPTGTTQPTDTATAAILISHIPWAIASFLFGLQTGTSPFQPTLSAAPNDFTIAISYTGSGLDGPAGLAIDKSGNVWVANLSGSAVSEFGPTGAPLSGSGGVSSGGLNAPFSIAIDASGNAWVTNSGNASISEFNPSGSPISGSPYTLGGLSSPYGIAIDQSGHVWVANHSTNNSISEFSSGGSPITGSAGITTGGLDVPYAIAIDVSGNVWVSNFFATSISEFNSSGTANADSPFSGGGLISPAGIAIDAAGNVWTANVYAGANSLSEFDPASSLFLSGSNGYTGGGLSYPYYVAVDGQGNVWATNDAFGGDSISEFTSTGTQICNSHSLFTCPAGYFGGGLSGPFEPAIDGAGNLWVSNYGSGSGNNITEFVGAASPVVTPIVANLLTPYGSHAVNMP